MIVTVEVLRDGAFTLLSDMEHLELIRIDIPAKKTELEKGKLSGQFAGALNISEAEFKAYLNALQESRNEWTRDIY